MKPIRPLFHNRYGPYGLGRQLYVAFQRWPDEERRRSATPTLTEQGDVLRPVPVERRKAQPFEERRKFQQRTHREPKSEDVERRLSVERRVAQLPRITAVISQARERGWLLPEEVEHLHRAFLESLAEDRYDEWLRSARMAPLFEEPGWSEKDNYEKYRLFRFASLVDLFRLGEIDWYAPDPNDMRLALKLLRAFGPRSEDANRQRAFIRKLFDPEESLEELARTRPRGLSPTDREILPKYLNLHGKQLAEALAKAGFEGFGMPALKKYAENRKSFYTIVSRWRQGIQ